MRAASRPAFPVPQERDEKESFLSLLSTAIVGLAAFSLIAGTIMWAFGLTLVDAGAIDSSWGWWTFFRLAALLHLSRGVLTVWAKRRD